MKCEICENKIEETFLKKPIGSYVKDVKGKHHLICNKCQRSNKTKQDILTKL